MSTYRKNRRTKGTFKVGVDTENAIVLGNKERISIKALPITAAHRSGEKDYLEQFDIKKRGKIIGFIDLLRGVSASYQVDVPDWNDDTDILLDNIEVDVTGKGYGLEAYGLLVQELRNRGVKRIFIFPKSQPQSFWARLGYREVKPASEAHYESGEGPLPLWVREI